MAVSLNKGGNVSLSKEEPGLKKILIGLGWDAIATDDNDFDLDASLFMLANTGKVRSDYDFIFYNNLKSTDGSVEHKGDNLTGAGDGDDEVIKVDLNRVPADVNKLVIGVTIYEADNRKQNFGMIDSAFIRVVNEDNNREIVRFDLSQDMSNQTAMLFGEVYRYGNEWKFRAIGQGFKGGLEAMARSYGLDVELEVEDIALNYTQTNEITIDTPSNKGDIVKHRKEVGLSEQISGSQTLMTPCHNYTASDSTPKDNNDIKQSVLNENKVSFVGKIKEEAVNFAQEATIGIMKGVSQLAVDAAKRKLRLK